MILSFSSFHTSADCRGSSFYEQIHECDWIEIFNDNCLCSFVYAGDLCCMSLFTDKTNLIFFSAILQLYFAFIFFYRKFAFSRYLTSNSIKYRFLRYSSLNKNFFISASGHLVSYRYFNKLNANQTLISSSRATGVLYSKHTKFAQHTEQNGKEGELIDFLFTASDIVLMT